MRLLVVGRLSGQLASAVKMAMAHGAKVNHVERCDQATDLLRRGQGADLLMVDYNLDIAGLIAAIFLMATSAIGRSVWWIRALANRTRRVWATLTGAAPRCWRNSRRTVEGSRSALPKDLLVASYQFNPNDVQVRRREGEASEVAFTLTLTGLLDITLRLMGLPVRTPMDIEINVHIDVETRHPLTIQLVPQRVGNRDIKVTARLPRELRALPTHLLNRINPLVMTVRESIVREVNAQLSRDDVHAATTIDVLKLAEGKLD